MVSHLGRIGMENVPAEIAETFLENGITTDSLLIRSNMLPRNSFYERIIKPMAELLFNNALVSVITASVPAGLYKVFITECM